MLMWYLMVENNFRRILSSLNLKKVRTAFLSSYPPRECGIATYSKDLLNNIDKLKVLKPSVVIAINDKGGHYNYQRLVKYQIDQEKTETARAQRD